MIAAGRVRVALVEPGRALVVVRGDSGGVWRVSYRRGGWSCPCPAYGRCAHLAVALLVVGRPGNLAAAEHELASGTDPGRAWPRPPRRCAEGHDDPAGEPPGGQGAGARL